MTYFLPHARMNDLIQAITNAGYPCFGPQVRDGTIMYDELQHANQLPWGMKSDQGKGSYRLEKSDENTAFAWVNGPQAIKPELFKSRETLWKVVRNSAGKLEFKPVIPEHQNKALFAVRPCDVRAMRIQDKVFDGEYKDAHYQQRRNEIFLIVANCTTCSANCFCLSAGGDLTIDGEFDLALTEIKNGSIAVTNSPRAETILHSLTLELATPEQLAEAEMAVQTASSKQTKSLPQVPNLAEQIAQNFDHPHWDDVAERCLSCGNCTMVCPTCFCHHESDVPELSGDASAHVREWDSCFTNTHSYIHGKVIRESTKARYRQWLTHKLSSWHEQFGTSGCVGCGRCVSWCPVGIDITEEAKKVIE